MSIPTVSSVVIYIDEHGTASVVGPFENADDAADFANHVNFACDDDGRCKIAGMTSVPDDWRSLKEPPD